MPVKCIYLVHSPKVKKIELVGRGSGCFRANLKNGWEKMGKTQLTTARIKKGVMKARGENKRKRTANRKQSGSVRYD